MSTRPRILLTHTPQMRMNYYGARALSGLRELGEVVLHDGLEPLGTTALIAAAGRRVRRSAVGSDGTNGSSPGTSRLRCCASHRPNQSRAVSKAVMSGALFPTPTWLPPITRNTRVHSLTLCGYQTFNPCLTGVRRNLARSLCRVPQPRNWRRCKPLKCQFCVHLRKEKHHDHAEWRPCCAVFSRDHNHRARSVPLRCVCLPWCQSRRRRSGSQATGWQPRQMEGCGRAADRRKANVGRCPHVGSSRHWLIVRAES